MSGGSVGLGRRVSVRILLAIQAHKPGNVVVREGVADRSHDVPRTVPRVCRFEDGRTQAGRRLLVGVGGVSELLARRVVHASQCLMVKDRSHDPMVSHGLVIWYGELGS
jgi:hypothetical protein